MPECAKTHSNLEFQNFPGEDPRTPLFKGRGEKGKGGEEREGKGKGGEGWEGTGEGRREGGEEWGGEGRALDMGSPLETSSGSAPWVTQNRKVRNTHTNKLSRRQKTDLFADEVLAHFAESDVGATVDRPAVDVVAELASLEDEDADVRQ